MITPSSREEWRAWLQEHHASEREVWLVYYKKHTGKPTVSYPDSVAEALCFGWIDGIKKRVDEERYTHRFTPRRPNSRWSPSNIELARELIETGQMTNAGLAAFEARKTYDETFLKQKEAPGPEIETDVEQGLRANEKAWAFFTGLAPSHRKNYIGWVQAAKKPETREKRLRDLITVLERGEKPGSK